MEILENVTNVEAAAGANEESLEKQMIYEDSDQNSEPDFEPVDEDVAVSISSDSLEAYIKFSPPIDGGRYVTMDDIMQALKESGVIYGIDHKSLENILNVNERYSRRYTVANGEKVEHGINGSLKFFFNIEGKTLAPKMNADGSVDYRSLNLVDVVDKGDTLAKVRPPTAGKEGMDVLGKKITPVPGKSAPKLPKGRNTTISQDGMTLTADVSGQVIYVNNAVMVSDVLEIKGDVDNSTGNIDFNGSIIIDGNVLPGFRVTAKGNIEVKGSIEGAEISCLGNLIVGKGILGMYKAKINVRGNTFSKMIQDANMETGGDIVSEGIMHSTIQCGGRIELKGKKGLLVGGSISCKQEIEANIVGSPMGTQTDIKVGLETGVFEKYRECMQQYKKLQKQYEDITKDLLVINKIKDASELPDVKRKSYVKSLYDAKYVQQELSEKKSEILVLKDELNKFKHSGKVTALSTVYPGVNIQVGNAVMSIRDNLPRCKFVNESGVVAISYNV